MDLVKTPLYSGVKGGGGGGRRGIPRSKNKRCDDEIRESATRGAQDDAETNDKMPHFVHGTEFCPCKPIGVNRHDGIRSDRLLETMDPEQHRCTINTVGKHVFPPRERSSWETTSTISYPPRRARPQSPAKPPSPADFMHEDKKLSELVSECRREYCKKERDTAPTKYTDQAYHTFQFQEDQRNKEFESTYDFSYPPRFVRPERFTSAASASHATPWDRKNFELLSEAQRNYIEHPPALTKPIINDQSRHTFNFAPEPRMSDTLHTSYADAYAPRLDHRPDRADKGDFFATHFKLVDENKERESFSEHQKNFIEYPPNLTKAATKNLYATNFKLFGSKDDWSSTYDESFANRKGGRPPVFSLDNFRKGVTFDLRDPYSRSEAMTSTNLADFVDHGLEKPTKEFNDLTKTNFFMTDPNLRDADFHKKTTYGENYAPRMNPERSVPFQSAASVIDDCMGKDRREVDMATTYQTDMIDHGPKPEEDKVDEDYIEKNMNPFHGVLSKGNHVKMAGNTGDFRTEHRENFNPKPGSIAISPEEMKEMKTRLQKSHFNTYHKFRDYLSEYQDRFIESGFMPKPDKICNCKCDCKCKCLTACECSGVPEPFDPYRTPPHKYVDVK